MRPRFHFLALLSASVLASSGFALAQTTAEGSGSGTKAPAAVGLTSAIEAAQAQFDGGVLEAELETHDGSLVYEIDLVSDGAVHQAIVDAKSGEVLSLEEQTLSGTWRGWFDDDRLQAAQAAGGTLLDALAAAEQRIGGQATEASLEEEDDRLFYEVEIETAQGDREVLIDPRSGEVTLGELDD